MTQLPIGTESDPKVHIITAAYFVLLLGLLIPVRFLAWHAGAIAWMVADAALMGWRAVDYYNAESKHFSR